MLNTNVAQQRARATKISSQDHLLRDQLQFFKESNALPEPPLDAHPDLLEQQYLNEIFRATHEETPTSALLPSVQERKLTRRIRRRRKTTIPSSPHPSFPPVFSVHPSKPSLFATKSAQNATESPLEAIHAPSSAQDASSMLTSMSLQQILDAKNEIYESLSPESITFLQNRSRQSSNSNNSQNVISSHTPPNTSHSSFSNKQIENTNIKPPTTPLISNSRKHRVTRNEQPHQNPSNHSSASSHRIPTQPADPLSQAAHPNHSSTDSKLDTDLNNSHHCNVHNHTNQATSSDSERAKTLWMTDATQPILTQGQVDKILHHAVQDMGPIAKVRFDLSGNILTPDQVAHLPSNKGLHHHGTAPASAGYTLSDLLILTRSTVTQQRVLAFKVLTAMITEHGDQVTDPLLSSGGLNLVFAPFSTGHGFHLAFSNQLAYLEAIESILDPLFLLPEQHLVPNLYFASTFYSPGLNQSISSPLLTVIEQPHCLYILVDIAHAANGRPSTVKYAKRALNICRTILFKSPQAANQMIDSQHASESARASKLLMNLAIGNDRLSPATTMLACDIIATIIGIVRWRDDKNVEDISGKMLTDDFMMQTAAHLNWVLRDASYQLTSLQKDVAKGALRLFRAQLAYNQNVFLFSEFLPAACRLLHDSDDELVIEAFLSLEVFIHSLVVNVFDDDQLEANLISNHRSSRRDEIKKTPISQFAKEKFIGLTPLVLNAAKSITDVTKDISASRKAAAGHFLATSIIAMQTKFDQGFYERVKCIGAEAVEQMSDLRLQTGEDFQRFETLASLCHATARILIRNTMSPTFLQSKTEKLLQAAHEERKFLDKSEEDHRWRLAANACAEWMGLFFRNDCNRRMIKNAVDLLSGINDAQIAVDILSRCVLKKESLQAMDSNITDAEAESIARKYIPLTWTTLHEPQNLPEHTSFKTEALGDKPLLVSIYSLISIWASHDDGSMEFTCAIWAFFRSGFMNNTDLFETLVEASGNESLQNPLYYDLVFTVGHACTENGKPLLESQWKTVRSGLSTSLNSGLSNSILTLTNQLVARGPYQSSSPSSSGSEDPLASIILSIMCGLEADIGLRAAMWKHSVEECGGAVLFKNAMFVEPEMLPGCNETVPLEEEDMISSYISSMVNDVSEPSRTPGVIMHIILRRFQDFLSTLQGSEALGNLFDSFPGGQRVECLKTISRFLEKEGYHCYKRVGEWVRKQPRI